MMGFNDQVAADLAREFLDIASTYVGVKIGAGIGSFFGFTLWLVGLSPVAHVGRMAGVAIATRALWSLAA